MPSVLNRLVIPNVLPDSLTHLTFGNDCNHPLMVGVFPSGLSHLTFGRYFSGSLPHISLLLDRDVVVGDEILPLGLISIGNGVYRRRP